MGILSGSIWNPRNNVFKIFLLRQLSHSLIWVNCSSQPCSNRVELSTNKRSKSFITCHFSWRMGFIIMPFEICHIISSCHRFWPIKTSNQHVTLMTLSLRRCNCEWYLKNKCVVWLMLSYKTQMTQYEHSIEKLERYDRKISSTKQRGLDIGQ